MTRSAPGYRGPSDDSRTAPHQPRGRAADVMDLIMADHRRIRRLGETLYGAARSAGGSSPEWVPGHVWQRLTDLLVAHFEAEERICYLPTLLTAPDTAGPQREAMADHDDIREAIREASLQRPGSAPWWHTVAAALGGSMSHLYREEHGVLADRLPRLTPGQRRMLGRQWSELTASWTPGSAPSQLKLTVGGRRVPRALPLGLLRSRYTSVTRDTNLPPADKA